MELQLFFDSTPQFNAMLNDTLPKRYKWEQISGVFALFTNRDKQIISSTNESFESKFIFEY